MRKYFFSYSVSTDRRDRNEKSAATITWREKQGTHTDLLTDIKSGLAYCNTFHHDGGTFTNSHKTRDNLKAAWLVSFDYDACKTAARGCFNTLRDSEICPTIIYTTANNGHDKQGKRETYFNRYRVVYCLDCPITSPSEYAAIHQAMKREIAVWLQDDTIYNDKSDSGQCERFYYGNGTDGIETYTSEAVTSLQWLRARYGINVSECVREDMENNKNKKRNKGSKASGVGDVSEWLRNLEKDLIKDIEKVQSGDNTIKKSTHTIYSTLHFLQDFHTKKLTDLVNDYIGTLQLLPEADPMTYGDGIITETPEGYRQIKHPYKVETYTDRNGTRRHECKPIRWKDGEVRRNKIFSYIMRLRQITPEATAPKLLWAACLYVCNFIEWWSEKDPITKNEIASKVRDALNTPLEAYERLTFYRPRYKVNTEAARAAGMTPRQAAMQEQTRRSKAAKAARWEQMGQMYDAGKTDAQNVSTMNEMGLKLSLRSFKEWKKAQGLTMPRKKTENNNVVCAGSANTKNNETAMKEKNEKKQQITDDWDDDLHFEPTTPNGRRLREMARAIVYGARRPTKIDYNKIADYMRRYSSDTPTPPPMVDDVRLMAWMVLYDDENLPLLN